MCRSYRKKNSTYIGKGWDGLLWGMKTRSRGQDSAAGVVSKAVLCC